MPPREPTSVRLRETPIRGELVNAVLSLSFYVVCLVIGLFPRRLRDRLASAFVSWSESVDERRYT
ncbi:MAG: serine/threonine protein phosphatase [Rhodococcus sp. (in: high G+C Gram-positive bacteria)]